VPPPLHGECSHPVGRSAPAVPFVDDGQRLREATNASDAIVFTSQAGITHPDELDYDAFDDLPYVASAGAFGLAWGASSAVTSADSFRRAGRG